MHIRLFAFAVALTLAAGCHAPTAAIMPRLGQFDISGHLGVQQGSSVSATNSVDSLGLQKDSSVFSGRVDIDCGPHITLSAQDSSHDGDGVAQVTLSSGGQSINSGDQVHSELSLGLYSAAMTWDFIPGDTAELGLGIGITALDVHAKLTDKTNPATVETKQAVPVPLIEGRAGVNLGPVELSALLGWIDVRYSGDRAALFDADLMARVRVLGKRGGVAGYLGVGYRIVDVKAEYQDNGDSADASIDFKGPWIGVALSF